MVTRILAWWPLLLAPLAMVLVEVADVRNAKWFLAKPLHETLAMVLTGASMGAYAVRYRVDPQPWYALLGLLALACSAREWHFKGTDQAIYISIAVLTVTAAIMHKRLLPTFTADRRFRVWVICTAFAYVVGVLLARRIFRDDRIGILRNEAHLHDEYEEAVENIAHFSLFITALIGIRRAK